ncbi:hypothetical protein PR003_g1043 [Phytophthora rubi]|uniref:Uncharacterized protein n=1 Tax=Phytophthora rubi TaxID=129364 RepID=A0A6A4G4D1_9STRA|nr:hypothetical protein PR003_g1043 [Phytophthora rubi]
MVKGFIQALVSRCPRRTAPDQLACWILGSAVHARRRASTLCKRQEHIVQCWRESREISFISLPIFHISQLICEVEADAPRSMGSVLLILGQV